MICAVYKNTHYYYYYYYCYILYKSLFPLSSKTVSFSMSMKVPTIVKEAQQSLQAGYCVVIGLQSTGEVCCVGLLLIIFQHCGKRQ